MYFSVKLQIDPVEVKCHVGGVPLNIQLFCFCHLVKCLNISSVGEITQYDPWFEDGGQNFYNSYSEIKGEIKGA